MHRIIGERLQIPVTPAADDYGCILDRPLTPAHTGEFCRETLWRGATCNPRSGRPAIVGLAHRRLVSCSSRMARPARWMRRIPTTSSAEQPLDAVNDLAADMLDAADDLRADVLDAVDERADPIPDLLEQRLAVGRGLRLLAPDEIADGLADYETLFFPASMGGDFLDCKSARPHLSIGGNPPGVRKPFSGTHHKLAIYYPQLEKIHRPTKLLL